MIYYIFLTAACPRESHSILFVYLGRVNYSTGFWRNIHTALEILPKILLSINHLSGILQTEKNKNVWSFGRFYWKCILDLVSACKMNTKKGKKKKWCSEENMNFDGCLRRGRPKDRLSSYTFTAVHTPSQNGGFLPQPTTLLCQWINCMKH